MTSLPILVGLTSVHYYSRAINFLLDNSKYSHCSIVLNEGQASLTVDCNILNIKSREPLSGFIEASYQTIMFNKFKLR